MRLAEILDEGRILRNSLSLLIIENPSYEQALGLMRRCARDNDGEVYIRGVMEDGKRVIICDGWKLVHDDLRGGYSDVRDIRSSRLTDFEASSADGEVSVTQMGDHDIDTNPYIENIRRALAAFRAV